MLPIHRRTPVLIVLLVGLLAGTWTYYLMRDDAHDQAGVQFAERLAGEATAAESRVHGSIETLHFLAGLYAASEEVTRAEFAAFTRVALERHPEILAVEWAPRVPGAERAAHVAALRARGLVDYDILDPVSGRTLRPAPERPLHYPVVFIAPAGENEAVLGQDLLAEPTRRAALERACASGQPALSDPVRLLLGPGTAMGVVVVLPVGARRSDAPRAVAERVPGVVLLVWRVEDFLAQMLRGAELAAYGELRVDLAALPPADGWRQLHFAPAAMPSDEAESLRASANADVADRRIRLVATPGAAFLARTRTDRPLLVGLLVALLTSLTAGAVAARLWRARRQAEEKNLLLTRSLLRSLDQGVIVADADGDIQLVNEAARAMVGGLGDTLQGEPWKQVALGRLLGAGDPATTAASLPLARAVRGEHFEDEDLQVPGTSAPGPRWLRISGAPLQSATGESLGGVIVFRDITEIKAQEDRITHLRTAVDGAADVIFITDRAGRLVYVNAGFEQTTGYAAQDVLGKTLRILKSGTHDLDFYRGLWGTILRGEVFHGMVVNRKKDGTLWHGDQSITPIRDDRGRVSSFVSVIKDRTEKRQLLEQEAEMRLAGVIQKRLYPQRAPQVEGLDLAGAAYPAATTCGDYFDFIDLPDGTLALVIGDVSGHGMGPALIMVEVRANLRSALGAGVPMEQALLSLNGLLCRDIPDDRFVSLLVVRVDGRARRLEYINAGHPPAWIVGASGEVRTSLVGTGPALGLFPEAAYRLGPGVELLEGDVIALVTDGLTEQRSPGGELFESDRVCDVLREHRARTANEILQALHAAARTFAEGAKAEDDLTLLIGKVLPR